MTYPISHVARATGRSGQFLIVPAKDYTARLPDCTLCTWIATGYMRFYLKFCNAACPVHARLTKITTS